MFLGLLGSVALCPPRANADSAVVFNEIMYHPAEAEPSMEWLELHNAMSVNLDLSNWSIDGGIEFRFPEGTVIPGGGYLVVSINPAALKAATGATNIIGPFTGRLGNSGEKLELRNNNLRRMDEVFYGTSGGWPVAADGAGVSLAKRSIQQPSGTANNWVASAQIGGTPGTLNFPTSVAPSNLVLVAWEQRWRFDNSGLEPDSAWVGLDGDDHLWRVAPAPFYGGDLPAPGGEIESIPTLFNTGIGTDGRVLPPGTADPHYLVVVSAEKTTPPPPAPATVIEGHPAWLENDDTSSWLGPVQPGTANVAPGDYRYRTTFDLGGFDPASAALTVAVSADNRLRNIFLNGVATGLSFVGFSGFSPDFQLTQGFLPGTNTLDFLWANDSTSPNPAGFRAKVRGTARRVAPPESRLTPVQRTTYFRTGFDFRGNPSTALLTLRAQADDGAVFYLNGQEILRWNLPPGPISASTPALTNGTSAPATRTVVIPKGALRAGTNLLAAELHQAADGLNDAWFAAEVTAELSSVRTQAEVVFNELADGDVTPFFIELANRSTTALPLEGYSIERLGNPRANHTFSADVLLPAGGLRAFTEAELGFRASADDTLVLWPPGRTSVADAVIVGRRQQGRFPDSTGSWLFPATPTPGEPNHLVLQSDVVINEIYYHPHNDSPVPEAWIELHNRGPSLVDLSGWRLARGIDFELPPGTILPAGGYLVVAQDPSVTRAQHPGIAVVGPFAGRLSRSQDRLILLDPGGNPAAEVEYFDGGRWPSAADGGGSSLELRNPWSDPRAAESWAASRESARAGWNQYSYRATATAAPGPTVWREFVLGMLSAGECLLDDLRVVESPSSSPVSLLQNGDFENGATSWRILGTHRRSRVIVDPDNPGNHVLHLVATGPTETMHNHLETTLANNRSVVNGREYEVSFRAKWLRGDNQLNTRLYFNRVAQTTRLAVPDTTGTPGAVNSTFETNPGPTFAEFQHTPAVPAVNQPVVVSARIQDPQGVSSAQLFWSANGGSWQSIVLATSPAGHFQGTIPGMAAGSVVQFYVQATDTQGASATFPAAGPESRALFQVNDQRARSGPLHQLRIIMTPADRDRLHALTNVMSNERLGATLVSDESEMFYDIGVHLQSSQRGRPEAGRVGFTLAFDPDHLFRGVHDSVTIDRSGGYTGVGADQDEILLKHALQHAGGLAGMYDDLVRVIPPRTDLTGTGLLLLSKYGDEFLDSQFLNGSDGNLFKLELIYFPTTTANGNVQGLKLPQPDEVLGVDLGNLGEDPEVYRWFYLQENNRRGSDYTPMIRLAKALNRTGTALDAEAHRLMDVSQWMRAVAFQSLWGLVDTFPFDNPHNFIIYFRPEDGRALPFLWDMDFNFGAAPNAPLNRATGNLGRLIALPGNQRLYLGHLLDLVTTTYNTNYLSPWITHFGSLAGQNFSGIRNYVDQRVRSVRSQLPASVPFSITSNGGQDFLVNTTNALLAGRAWIDAKEIVLEGLPESLEFKWPTTTSWQVVMPLILGPNRLTLQALDFQGRILATQTITVTSSAVGGGLDSDADGMPDLWETQMGLIPASPDGLQDADGDGQTNLGEYLAGTHPMDATRRLTLAAERSPDGLRLSFSARAGRSYSLLRRDSLNPTGWQRVTDAEPQAGDRRFDWVEPATNPGSSRFYRVVTPKMP